MKRIFSVILILLALCLALVPYAYAESAAEAITVRYNRNDYLLYWGSMVTDIPSGLPCRIISGKMPYWGDPDRSTDYDAGLIATGPTDHFAPYRLGRLEPVKLELFYAYDFTSDGYDTSKDNAQLYLAKFSMDRWTHEMDMKPFLEEKTQTYGEPILVETPHEVKSLNGNGQGWTTEYSYERDYTWDLGDNIAIRLTCTYEPWSHDYANAVVYFGRTDMDSSLREGKLMEGYSFVQAHVIEDGVPLYNVDGTYNKNIPANTEITITKFNPAFNMLEANVTIRGGYTEENGTNIHSHSWSSEYLGYITGDGLNVSKEELIEYFSGATTAIPIASSLAVAGNSSGSTQHETTKDLLVHQYVLNTHTMKFHDIGCRSIKRINAGNRAVVEMTREDVLAAGYSPCQICHP